MGPWIVDVTARMLPVLVPRPEIMYTQDNETLNSDIACLLERKNGVLGRNTDVQNATKYKFKF